MYIHSSKIIVLLCFSFLIVLLVATEELAFSQVIKLNKDEDIRIMGVECGDWFGYAVSNGDINGDGFDDIIIGAPIGWSYYSSLGYQLPVTHETGLVYVIFGRSSPASTIDISNVSADITIYGNDDSCDSLGHSVSSGDINNDGYDDIIIGDPGGHPIDRDNTGVVYVIFGSASPASEIDLNNIQADITIYGDDSGDNMGDSLSNGDINNDGYDDIIIGAPLSDPVGGRDAGEVYIIFGSASPASIIDLNNVPSPANMIIYGGDQNYRCGSRVSIGNINGDNYEDIIISARIASPMGRERAGEIYVIFGSGTPRPIIDLNSISPDLIIYGNTRCEIGKSLSSGDINSDGNDDIIIGAWNVEAEKGILYVIYGSASPPSIIDLQEVIPDITIIGFSGNSIFIDDVNHDTYDDFIIGCSGFAGKTYIIYGYNAASGTRIDFNTTQPDMTIYGYNRLDRSGYSVSCGDINGDGCGDVIIGAPQEVTRRTFVCFKAGDTYIIYGCSLPIECNFTDTDISEWKRIGNGTAVVEDGQLLLKDSKEFPFHVFPTCALARNCIIDAKVTRKRKGGAIFPGSDYSSSILFRYINEMDFWEFRIEFGGIFGENRGGLILQHIKNCTIEEQRRIPADINFFTEHKIHLEIKERQIKVSVDGDYRISIFPTERNQKKGRISLGYFGPGTCLYDDLYISKLEN
jgi:hypothetical protein